MGKRALGIQLGMLCLALGAMQEVEAVVDPSGTWNNTAGLNWDDPVNWNVNPSNPPLYPDGLGTVAAFVAFPSGGSQTITLTAPKTIIIGSLHLDTPAALNISLSGSTLEFENFPGDNSTIFAGNAGGYKISAPVTISGTPLEIFLYNTEGVQAKIWVALLVLK